MQYYPSPEEVIDMDVLIQAVESAFVDHGTGRSVMPPKVRGSSWRGFQNDAVIYTLASDRGSKDCKC